MKQDVQNARSGEFALRRCRPARGSGQAIWTTCFSENNMALRLFITDAVWSEKAYDSIERAARTAFKA